MTRWGCLAALVTAMACLASSCGPSGADAAIPDKGSLEITAELVEIPQEFPSNKLYDYAYVMKYRVIETHRGDAAGDTIYIGHYNPLKPRSSVADARVPDIGGSLRTFRPGARHRMALESSIDDHYMGGIIDPYAGDQSKQVYWAVWTNPAG